MVTFPALAGACLASLLLVAAGLKASDRPGTVVALATYGLDGRLAAAARNLLIAAEGVLAIGLLAGARVAAVAAAGTFAAFGVAQAAALARGRGGAPCGCLGARGRLSWLSVMRTLGLAAALALVVPEFSPVAAAAALAIAAASVLLLRPRRPAGALDVAGEGPRLGSRLALPGEGLRLVVFTEPGCGLCRDLRPALGRIERKDRVVVLERDAADHEDVPGAPYAVVVGPGDEVLAKGSVNTARQLRSLVAAARAGAGAAPDPDRRAFLRTAAGAAATASLAPAVGSLIRPGEAEAYHFCGHIYTTDSCPHPTGLPRIDSKGFPLRAKDGHRVDDLGRLVDVKGRPVDERGARLLDADGLPLPAATRTRVCTATARAYRQRMRVDGAWYRCCGGRVRKLVDCCTTGDRRINGDRALTGYCYAGRKVFCVMYYQTRVPC